MSYSETNPPICVTAQVNFRHFVYKSVDAATLVRAAGYITNGKDLGMVKGDTVTVIDTDSSPVAVTLMNVVSINTATGAANLSDGTAITATDTD